MAKPPCKPLKITAHLVDGRLNSADGIVMFDAFLYHAWFAKYAPEVLDGIKDENWHKYIGLPLRQIGKGRWAASRGVYECLEQTVEYYNKRPDFLAPDKMQYLDTKKGIISDSAGEYRAYRVPSVVRIVKDGIITFYAVGHCNEVLELLNLIPAVGKKNSMGYGFVDRWEVEEIEEDYSLWHPEHGLMRPLPIEDVTDADKEKVKRYPIMQYAVKPPYYKVENMKMCYVPIGGFDD